MTILLSANTQVGVAEWLRFCFYSNGLPLLFQCFSFDLCSWVLSRLSSPQQVS
jgi:hypothetical protein